MQHAILFLYFLIFSFGLMVLGISSVLAYKSKSKKLFVYFLLLSAYSFNLFTIILESYSSVNMPWFQKDSGAFWTHIMMFSHFLLMFAVLLLNGYFSTNGNIGPRWIPYAFLCIALYVYDWIYPRRSIGFRIFGVPVVDLLFFGSIVYILVQGYLRLSSFKRQNNLPLHSLEMTFFSRLQWSIVILLPFVLNDDLHFVSLPIRFSPLLYAVINVVFLQLLFKFYLAHYYISESDIHSLEKTENHPVFDRYGITEREREIIVLVLKGYSNIRIGKELFVSLATVKTHIYNIFKKTGIKSRFELIYMMKK
ncbi:MAG: hypothetical protein JXB03_02090 [Spirochaetales bacterium]|nr:hypothetical protein [Spirochaetales bacterium]